MRRRLLMMVAALVLIGLPGVAIADTFTFKAPATAPTTSSPNQVDLDHHNAYTWRFGSTDSNGNTVNLSGQQILGASISFKSMQNWDANTNRLFIHLLDTARTTGNFTTLSGSGGVGVIRTVNDVSTSQAPVTDISDYFGAGSGLSAGNALVAQGTGDTFLTSQAFRNSLAAPPATGQYALGAGWSFANGTYTYTFTQAQLQVLSAYFANGNDLAFGLDADCHYFNNGISFNMTTGKTAVPEPATMVLLGTGLAGVAARLRKRRKAAKNSDSVNTL